jgi:hypothetical protein
MKDNEFDTFYNKAEKLRTKLAIMEKELKDLLSHIEPVQQFHRPALTISRLRNRYYHCSAPIKQNGKLTRHSCHLGAIEQLLDINETNLKRIAEKKMGELLRKKYPHMFE